eukprot:TRINITY_DN3418_c0_g1_i1.p1 TRINITY_DN3418_c0_g1~~TRINITY_DN3418_c0_g1_i1.p1  ORF type:complete len:167 (+),score=11.03 TRINITY_DN3418_c0_g1_i1:83-583(+)
MGQCTAKAGKYPVIGSESIMSQKGHGTTEKGVQKHLRWGCEEGTANRICCFNRHKAEFAHYFETTSFLRDANPQASGGSVEFFDSVSGKRVFHAPRGRSWSAFIAESKKHGWPSFRDAEVDWTNVRCLENGECVSTVGTHLGHNLADCKGNRYCINLVSIAGKQVF